MEDLLNVRRESLERLKSTQIFQRLLGGGLDRNVYASYLINVYHYAQHSPKVIALAGSRCVQTNPELASYLLQHATEEIGHESWAYSDLKKLGLSDTQITSSRPGTFCTSMIGMEYFVAGHWNPVALFGWLFVLEAFGDDVGHLIAKKLEQSLQIGTGTTSFLAGHGDADHDHIRDITECVEKHMKNPADMGDMLHIAKVSRDLYIGILEEVAAENRKWL